MTTTSAEKYRKQSKLREIEALLENHWKTRKVAMRDETMFEAWRATEKRYYDMWWKVFKSEDSE